MPAQKRSYEPPSHLSPPPLEANDDLLQRYLNHGEQGEDGDDGSHTSSGGDKDEFILVKLAEIRKEVQCPICLGIIRKTRTVMECLHRFCRECIDKSMRLGNNECPACRTHCASRRSLRDDPNYDALISALYPDIDSYEEEELAFHEEEKARNKQIQASIAQTLRRQTEALGRKRTARATAAAFVRTSQGSYRNLRGRRNHRAAEHQESDDDDEDTNGHDAGKDSSSADEHIEFKPKRYKRWGGARFSQISSGAASADGGCDDNDAEMNRESVGVSAGLVGSSEMLVWGKGGMRSHTRHGNLSGGNGKHGRNSRLSKLIDCLRSSEENENVLDIHLMLVSLDGQKIPNLQRPYLCCRPTLSVKHICQYVAIQTSMPADEVEMLLVKEFQSNLNPSTSSSVLISRCRSMDPCKDELHALEEHETLVGLQARFNFRQRNVLLAFRQKLTLLGNS